MKWDLTITLPAIFSFAILLSAWLIYFLNKNNSSNSRYQDLKKTIFSHGLLKKLILAAADFEKVLSLAAKEHRLIPAPFAFPFSPYKKICKGAT